MTINLYAAWICFLCGCLSGIVPGLFFHRADWLGGYASWERRMIRLGHIAFFGLGLLNVAFVVSADALGLERGLEAASVLFVVGAATMSLVCFLSAWKPIFRNLFCIPALSVTAGVALFVWRMVGL